MPAHLKPPELRQRRNKKAGAAELSTPTAAKIPVIPNPDKRKWHPLTKVWWANVWKSPMATRYLTTDLDGLGMVALLVDEFYRKPDTRTLSEIRLQQARFGLSPLDRNRMDWTVTEAPENKPRPQARSRRDDAVDPRRILKAVK